MTSNQFFNRLAGSKLIRFENEFKAMMKSSIRIHLSKRAEEDIPIGASKIGGMPDLPIDATWPTDDQSDPLSFIAQINCREACMLDEDHLLPTAGVLYFFYTGKQDAWGFNPNDINKFGIFYHNTSPDQLRRHEFPESLSIDARFGPNALNFTQDISFPPYETKKLDFLNYSELDELDQLLEVNEQVPINKMLGYSDNIQGLMELECELAGHGLRIEDYLGYEDNKRKQIDENLKSWRLLLQVDSNDEAGMMWGDAGRLYFWIKESDLKEHKFKNAWFSLQCY